MTTVQSEISEENMVDLVLLVVNVVQLPWLFEAPLEVKELVKWQIVPVTIAVGVVGAELLAETIHHRRLSLRVPHEKVGFVGELADTHLDHLSSGLVVHCLGLTDDVGKVVYGDEGLYCFIERIKETVFLLNESRGAQSCQSGDRLVLCLPCNESLV